MLVWIGWDLIYKDKPTMLGTVNGMITGLVTITPAAGFVNGYGAIIIGISASTIVWMSIRYLSRVWPFRKVDDTLGVIYTHGIAGLAGGLMVAKLFLSLDARQYWSNAWQVLVLQDVFMGLFKPVLFGFIIATVGCYYGMTARGGTQGVGRATTQAVVAASVFILVTDFFVTKLLISLLSYK